jgi:hypothetical protein
MRRLDVPPPLPVMVWSPEAENKIIEASKKIGKEGFCLEYAIASKQRFIAGEKFISKNAHTAFIYAREVIKGPWLEGEEAIAKDAYYSLKYSTEIIKKRFIRGEKILKSLRGDEMFKYQNHWKIKL